MARDPLQGRDIIFEFITLGDSVRVAAVDTVTGEEVVVAGPIGASQTDLERVAARKLARRLGLAGEGESKTPRRGGRGVIV